MAEQYIQPDMVFNVPIQDGELKISPAYDRIDSFKPLGAFMLKYFLPDGTGVANIVIDGSGAQFLRTQCGLHVVERTMITATEHDKLVEWQTDHFDQLFGGRD